LDEFGGHVFGGCEVAAPAGFDGRDRQRDSVGLAAAWLTEEHDGPVLLDESQDGQVVDGLAVDRGLELEVGVLDRASDENLASRSRATRRRVQV
jgi:hypothetical protein